MWKRLKGGGKHGLVKGGGILKYKVLLQKDQNDVSALSKLGIIYFESGENEKACELLRKAKSLLGVGGGSGKFWRTLGRALLKKWYHGYDAGRGLASDAQEAVEAFEFALKQFENATNPTVYIELGKAYEAYGAFEGAMQVYGNVVVNFPTWNGLPRAVFNAAVLSLHPSLLNIEESKRYFENIMIEPPKPFTENQLLFQLARIYQLMGNRKLARDAFTEVFKRLKIEEQFGHQTVATWINDPRMWIAKGDFHVKHTNYVVAVDAFEEALRRQKPPQKDALYKCALALKVSGQDDEALQYMEQAYALDDSFNLKYRSALLKWDESNWRAQFDGEGEGATEMQRIIRGCWGRLRGLQIMAVERELRRRKFVGAVGLQRLSRGVLGRIFAREEKKRFFRYKQLVSRSLKRMQLQVQLFALKLLKQRISEIKYERRKARKRYEKILTRKNMKRMKQRNLLAAFHGWYENVQDLIEARWQHRNHMASSIALFYRFILWRIERRERERKIRWALARMQRRWMEEGFHAWDEFRVFSICIKIQKRRTAHRMKREAFRILCHFVVWNKARKVRLEKKRKLRNIRLRNDIVELLGNFDPLIIDGRHDQIEDLDAMKAWARRIRLKEQKLQNRAIECKQSLNFQGRLALQSGCLNGLLPRLPRAGESQVGVLEREYQMGLQFVKEKPTRILPALSIETQVRSRTNLQVEEKSAAPSALHKVLWPIDSKVDKVGRLTGSHLREVQIMAHDSRQCDFNDKVHSRTRKTSWEARKRTGLLPGLLEVDILDETKKHASSSIAKRQNRAEQKRESLEQENMEAAEIESRTKDAILDDADRVRDIVRFRQCVHVCGPMDEHLFCNVVLPGRLYCQIAFRAACLIQLWMLISHPARKIRHMRAAKRIQYAWWDCLDRRDARRELRIRRVIRKMGGERNRRTFWGWRCAASRQRNARKLIKRHLLRYVARVLESWRVYTSSQRERRRQIQADVLRRLRLRRAEHAFDAWANFTDLRQRARAMLRRRLRSDKARWFYAFCEHVEVAKRNCQLQCEATRIQAIVRGQRIRLMVDRKREAESAAVLFLQRGVRRLIARKTVHTLRRKRQSRHIIRSRMEDRRVRRGTNDDTDHAAVQALRVRREEILTQLREIQSIRARRK